LQFRSERIWPIDFYLCRSMTSQKKVLEKKIKSKKCLRQAMVW